MNIEVWKFSIKTDDFNISAFFLFRGSAHDKSNFGHFGRRMNIFVWLEPYFIATDYVHVCYTHYGSIKIIRDLAELNDFRQKLYLNPNATDICQSKSAREGGGLNLSLEIAFL